MISEPGETLLQMQRNGVIYIGANSLICRIRAKFIAAAGHADHILIVNVPYVVAFVGQCDLLCKPRVRKQSSVTVGVRLSLVAPTVEKR